MTDAREPDSRGGGGANPSWRFFVGKFLVYCYLVGPSLIYIPVVASIAKIKCKLTARGSTAPTSPRWPPPQLWWRRRCLTMHPWAPSLP